LQYAVAQDKAVEKRGTGVQADQDKERIAAGLMGLLKQQVGCRVRCYECRHLPKE
jgi:hypothetical protein